MKTLTFTRLLAVVVLAAMLLPMAANAQVKMDDDENAVWNAAEQETGTHAQSDAMFFKNHNFQVAVTIGWVAKDWKTLLNGKTYHEDLWGNMDKKLNGLQLGFNVQSFSQRILKGLGIRFGIYYEWYISNDKSIKELGFDRFNEHSLYFPFHVMFRMTPFKNNKNFSIIPFGGIGFNWAMMGKLKSGPWGLTDQYGRNKVTGREYPLAFFDYNNHTPHHWNVQAEAGVAVCIKRVQLAFTYSWGLNHHRLYDESPSRQNKLAVNLSLIVPTNLSKD